MKYPLTRPKFLMIIRRISLNFKALSHKLIKRVAIEVIEFKLINKR